METLTFERCLFDFMRDELAPDEVAALFALIVAEVGTEDEWGFNLDGYLEGGVLVCWRPRFLDD